MTAGSSETSILSLFFFFFSLSRLFSLEQFKHDPKSNMTLFLKLELLVISLS